MIPLCYEQAAWHIPYISLAYLAEQNATGLGYQNGRTYMGLKRNSTIWNRINGSSFFFGGGGYKVQRKTEKEYSPSGALPGARQLCVSLRIFLKAFVHPV